MPIEQAINEMKGKISLLENPIFMRCAGAIGIYYVAWLGYLTHHILHTGGFH